MQVTLEDEQGVADGDAVQGAEDDRPAIRHAASIAYSTMLKVLLGFRGKYALSSGISSLSGQSNPGSSRASAEIQSLIRQARDKIDRIRGQMSFLPDVAPPEVKQSAGVDRWSRGLGIAAVALLLLVILMYGGFWFALDSGVSQLV